MTTVIFGLWPPIRQLQILIILLEQWENLVVMGDSTITVLYDPGTMDTNNALSNFIYNLMEFNGHSGWNGLTRFQMIENYISYSSWNWSCCSYSNSGSFDSTE